jgi:hypothetical protein
MSIRVSAINWDCSLPSDTYFGYYQTRTLSPRKYRTVTPFYADILGEDKIDYHVRSQAEYDRELSYAIEAGIDYLSYVFYPEEGSKAHAPTSPSDCSHKVYELNYARKMHEKSALRDKIGMAAFVGAHTFAQADYIRLATLLKQPYYEKVDGRPIVYFFRLEPEYVHGILDAVSKVGGEKPLFFAYFNYTPETAPLVDGCTAYACGPSNIHTHRELVDVAIKDNLERSKKAALTVPLFPTGWDPSPRVDLKSPWVDYPNEPYAKTAAPAELVEGAKRFAAAIKESENLSGTFFGHIQMFAWNEFEEGGFICPTYNEDLSVNTDRVKAVKEIIKHWKETL